MSEQKLEKEENQSSTNVAALADFYVEFSQESDRACVILCAAKIDYLLCEILSKFLVPNTSTRDELLDSEGALGTFSSRIQAAYRLKLIDAGLTRSLHLLRRLRNSFAHEMSKSSLETGAHRDRVREIFAPLEAYIADVGFDDLFKDKPPMRAAFEKSASWIMVLLNSLCEKIKPVSPSHTANLRKASATSPDSSGKPTT